MSSCSKDTVGTEIRTQAVGAYTPGPWVTDRTTDDRLAVRAESDRFAICTFMPFVKNHEANARLCAASPTMHAALTEIDGEAPEHEPAGAAPTVGAPRNWSYELAEYVQNIVQQAFEEGKARGRWEAAAHARAALVRTAPVETSGLITEQNKSTSANAGEK